MLCLSLIRHPFSQRSHYMFRNKFESLLKFFDLAKKSKTDQQKMIQTFRWSWQVRAVAILE